MHDIIFKNGFVVTPNGLSEDMVAIKNGEISKIAPDITDNTREIVDLKGNFLMPGVIDTHVHFREPGGEEKETIETGTMAAVAGGVTTVLDMPNTDPPTVDQKGIDQKIDIAKKTSYSNIGFYLGVTKDNVSKLSEYQNYAGLKMYMGSSTGNLFVGDSELQEEAFKNAKKILCVHAEDQDMIEEYQKFYQEENDPEIHSCIRHRECAIKAVDNAIKFAEKTGCKLHICHMSTFEELDLVKQAKEKGINVTCEVAPHHLFLNDSDYVELDNFLKMNPPVRGEMDNKILMDGVINGGVDTIATDHAPHLISEKEKGYWDAPAGVPEVEMSLPLMLNQVNKGVLTIEIVAQVMCHNPAEIFGMENKGKIKEGYDADLIIVDMSCEKKIDWNFLYTKCGWSPYRNWEIKGWPIQTYINGELVFDRGKFHKPKKIKIIK